MKTPIMQQHKVARALRTHGKKYDFYRDKRDSRNEPVLDEHFQRIPELVHSIIGIYHEQADYFVSMMQEDTAVRTETNPMILTMRHEDLKKLIPVSDYVMISDTRYDYVAVRNVNNFDLFCNISLELVDNGLGSV